MQQLWVHIFGIHSCGETVAKRGSDEVVSCWHSFLNELPQNITSLRLYSDGCGGQNKNASMMSYLFTLVAVGRFQQIQHSFPVIGHSFLPNDRDFGRTEINKRKNERVYTDTQWMSIIEGARQRKPFKAVQATQSMFYSFTRHFSSLFKKTVKNKQRSLNIQSARVMNYSADHATEVWVKYTASDTEEWSKFQILKKGATASLPSPRLRKYRTPAPVKATKAADVQKIVSDDTFSTDRMAS